MVDTVPATTTPAINDDTPLLGMGKAHMAPPPLGAHLASAPRHSTTDKQGVLHTRQSPSKRSQGHEPSTPLLRVPDIICRQPSQLGCSLPLQCKHTTPCQTCLRSAWKLSTTPCQTRHRRSRGLAWPQCKMGRILRPTFLQAPRQPEGSARHRNRRRAHGPATTPPLPANLRSRNTGRSLSHRPPPRHRPLTPIRRWTLPPRPQRCRRVC